MFEKDLLSGKSVHLTAIEPEEDAAVISLWTADTRYRLLMEMEKERAWTPVEVKKHYETHLKDSDEHRNEFHFGIRSNTDNRLVGVFSIPWVGWTNHALQFRLGFGDTADLQNWGEQAVRIGLGYMFGELNMHLVTIHVPEFCPEMIAAVEEAGLSLTARRREVLYYYGQHYDSLWYSVLRPDWAKTNSGYTK